MVAWNSRDLWKEMFPGEVQNLPDGAQIKIVIDDEPL
jgi:hypothetical protein